MLSSMLTLKLLDAIGASVGIRQVGRLLIGRTNPGSSPGLRASCPRLVRSLIS